jgi:hypothetical protein
VRIGSFGLCVAWDVLVGAASVARGADEAPLLAYSAPAACPSGAQFAAAVESRGRRIQVVADESTSVIYVTINPQSGGYHGRIRMGPGLASGTVRDVRGATCEIVVEALAVVLVSAMGPADDVQVPSSQAADYEQGGTAPKLPAEAPPSPAPPPQPPAPPLAPAASPPPAARTERVGPAPPEVNIGAGKLAFETDNAMTLLGGVAAGLIPSVVLPRFDFTWSRTNLVATPDGHRYRVFPTVQLYGSVFANGVPYRSRYGSTEANGLGGGADLCAPLYYDRSALQFDLCADLLVGYFGVGTTSPQGVRGPARIEGVGTAGVQVDFAYNLGRHFHLGLKAGGAVVLGPLTAEASDGSTIFKSSLFSGNALFGAGGHF